MFSIDVAGLLKGSLVKSWLDADFEYERKVFTLKTPRLDPRVGQPGEEEVPQVEGQLDDHRKDAHSVDKEPSGVWVATKSDHF